MTQIEFDTHRMIEAMEEANIRPDMAKAVTYAIRDIAMSNVATKQDLSDMENRLTVRFGVMLASGLALVVAVLGVLISLN